MRTRAVQKSDWRGVFAVPPLARNHDAQRSVNWERSSSLVTHMHRGGITRLLYGGNAFLYHMSLGEYEGLLDWLMSQDDELWCIPSAGPSFGRLCDQAKLLKGRGFPAVMHLPCADPRDAAGLEAGLQEFSDSAATPLILYLKDENNFGPDRERGLDAVARLTDKGVCVGIKYAVVREHPERDTYLEALLKRVDRSIVVSGIGERPAIVHMRDFELPGYTTGSGCIGSAQTSRMFELCEAVQYEEAAKIRECFLPLEDIRDASGPARVLHDAAGELGFGGFGPIPPFVSAVSPELHRTIARSCSPLLERG